jgi:hypothetical protein
LDPRWGGEPVYRFDLGVKAVLTTLNQKIDDGIGATVVTGSGPADLGPSAY